MAKITIHAGDWAKGQGSFGFGAFALPKEGAFAGFETVRGDALESVELASEDAVKRVGGTVGWGLTGAVLLGPVGLLAGLLAGGRGKNVTFIAKFKDGRKILATTDSKVFVKIQALVF